MESKSPEIRIDKWLWAVRVFKTRTLAAEACGKGRILLNGVEAKASRSVKPGDMVLVRKPPVVYTYKVVGIINSRASAPIARLQYEDLTSVEELDKLKINETFFVRRERGAGRPTKKERRLIDKLGDTLTER